MNKKRIIILVSAIALIIVVFLVLFMDGCTNNKSGEDTYSKNIKIMNENGVSLVIYGDEINFRDGVEYDTISEINKSSFEGNEFLVINDRTSNVVLNDEDYTEIKELVSNGVTFMYIGGSKLATFKEKEFFTNTNNYLGFTMSAISCKVTHGIWSNVEEEAFKVNDELLGSIIVGNVVKELKK